MGVLGHKGIEGPKALSATVRSGPITLTTALVLLCAGTLLALAIPASASAAAPELLWKTPEDGKAGTGAGRFDLPAGIGVNSDNGHLYVADLSNRRINELDAWGEFVKAWGGGVVPGGAGGSGDLTAGSNKVTSLTTTSKVFVIGQEISGAGIPAATTIADIGIRTLTLSKPATATATGVALSSPEGPGNVPADERQTVTIGGSPTGGSFTLTFTGGETTVDLNSGSSVLSNAHTCCGVVFAGGAYHVGDAIGRPSSESGIPPGTTITAIGDDTLTLSAPATRTGGMAVSAEETTAPISYNAPAAGPGSVQAALEALPAIGAGNVSVSGPAGGPYEVEFEGELADVDHPPMRADGAALAPSGTVALATAQGGAGAPEVCVAICEAGRVGGLAGQFVSPSAGVAVDAAGDAYVAEMSSTNKLLGGPNFRVQKFDPSGSFLAMWGGEVNKTKSAEGGSTEAERNLCTKAQLEAGDVCGAGVPGSGDGQFAQTGSFGNRIAVGPDGSVYVGDVERIQRFSPAGAFEGELALPGQAISSLAMDGAGSFYATYQGSGGASVAKDVRKLVPSGEALSETMAFPADSPRSVALDGAGNLYVVDHIGPQAEEEDKVIAYDPSGAPLVTGDDHLAESGSFLSGLATSEACGLPGSDLYVSDLSGFLSSYGPAPQDVEACPPPEVAPTISKQFATAVGTDSATLRAQINPQFWNDTRYYVEYGTGECASGGCDMASSPAPGTLLSAKVTKQQLQSKGVVLAGLEPRTTYHYRFVAQSSGGGPVYGVDPDGPGPAGPDPESGLEGTFRTQPQPGALTDSCPNAAFRSGASARLPDCRAYEMVSPLEKEGGDIIVLNKPGTSNAPMSLDQASPDGERLSYSSYRAFGDAQSAPITSAFLASRGPDGWASHGISPPRGGNTWLVADSLDAKFKAFSPDLCQGWVINETDLPLTEDAPAGFANLYRRDNCGEGEGGYEALIPVAPDSVKSFDFQPELQGVSGDGGRTLFRVRDKLTADAIACTVPGEASTCRLQLYEAFEDGTIRMPCILPDETAAPQGCSAGSASGEIQGDGRSHMVRNAISADGSRVFWSDRPETRGGKIYLRKNTEQLASARLHGAATGTGELTGPAKGTGNLIKGAVNVSAFEPGGGGFAVGQSVSGEGIAAATTIVECTPSCQAPTKLKLSKAATASKTGAVLTGAASEVVSGVITSTGAFATDQEISGPGIPAGTTISACAPSCGAGASSLILSAKATKTTTGSPLSATSPCTEADKACTVAVSAVAEALSGVSDAQYWTAADDGSAAIFSVGSLNGGKADLYRYSVAGEETILIAGDVYGVAGASEDASRIYLVSGEVLGEGAAAGKPNLYLYEAGEGFTFIGGALSDADATVASASIPFSLVHVKPNLHTAQASADGLHLAFMSSAPLTGYDNTDAQSGKADAEVFLYDTSAAKLRCVSCNPTGALPSGHVVSDSSEFWAAALLPTSQTQLYQTPQALSEDGSRLYFESFEGLVPSDGNGLKDVYQWEAPGAGSCGEGSPSFEEAAEGCIDLISSGTGREDSSIVAVSPGGDDVFFATAASLLPQDPGLVDIYDARALGGFPAPPTPTPFCEGEACQAPPAPPEDATPASASFEGAGNVTGETPAGRKRCAKGKVRRKGRCVTKKQRRGAKHRANRNRGATR